jgi:phosphoglycolate phosphatase-like HAD superfamily hydrolase
MLLNAIEALGGKLHEGYMIGDSQTDILTAVNAGTGAIYVSYGYNRGVSVDQYQPIKIDQLTQLIELFG